MPRKSNKGAQSHPGGAVVSVTIEQRAAIKAARKLKGWDQKQLALRAKTTPATISNLEGGRSKQARKVVYLRILKALRVDDVPVESSAVFEEAFEMLLDLDAQELRKLIAMAGIVTNRPTKPA